MDAQGAEGGRDNQEMVLRTESNEAIGRRTRGVRIAESANANAFADF